MEIKNSGEQKRLWPQLGPHKREDDPTMLAVKTAMASDSDASAIVRLPLRVVPQQDSWIVADALRDRMHRDTRVKQGGGLDAAQVKPRRPGAQPFREPCEPGCGLFRRCAGRRALRAANMDRGTRCAKA